MDSNGFTEWVKANLQKDGAVTKTVLAQIKNIVGDLKQETVDGLLFNPLLPELMFLCKDFLNHLRQNNGNLSAYWMCYIYFVEDIVLLHPSQEGNWDLHLNTIRAMIPWCLAMTK